MPVITDTTSSKAPKHTKHEAADGVRINAGPFVGTVKNNIDTLRSGRLQVYIPELGGDPDNDSSWRTVSYCTPFYGQVDPGKRSNDQSFSGSPQSYGMWFVPPDVGVKVLCTFVNGDPFRGYWFGCIPEWPNLHMVPGISSGQWHGGSPDPLVEYNYNDPAAAGSEGQFFQQAQTAHDYQKQTWQRQGLSQDPVRGPGISSAFRETPSRVFGISTPGPEIQVASDAATSEGEADLGVQARQGGHQFIMDDGDINGNSQLIKLRTSNGNMLLMNDSAGIVYLINAAGSAWFEMDGAGNVRVYSQAKIEMHATAGFVFETPGPINLNGSTIDIAASGPLKLKGMSVDISGMTGVKMGAMMGDIHLSGMKAYLSGKSCVGISGGSHVDMKAGCVTLNTKKVTTASPPGMATGQQGPTHEPYGGHQNVQTNSPSSGPSQAAASGLPAGAAGNYGASSSFGLTAGVPTYYGVVTNATGPIKFNPGLQGSYSGQAASLGDAATLNQYDANSAAFNNIQLPLPVATSGFSVNIKDPTITNNKNLKPGEALNNPGDLSDLTGDPFAVGQVNGLNSYASAEDGIAALSLLLDIIQSEGAKTVTDFISEYIARKGKIV